MDSTDFEKSKTVEASITPEEHERAQALEAILLYDSMVKARESKEEVLSQIKRMNQQSPINLEGNLPASQEDLKQLLERLASYESSQQVVSNRDLEQMFDRLANFYEGRTDIQI